MFSRRWKQNLVWRAALPVLLAGGLLWFGWRVSKGPPVAQAATSGVFAPACGTAAIDGVVSPGEWVSATAVTAGMQTPGANPTHTVTVRVMNGAHYLYLGFTIDDDEFTPLAQYLPRGDDFRVDFDNDASGSIFAVDDDVLVVAAGSPQFEDGYIVGSPSASSSRADMVSNGSSDGYGRASRVGSLNHFEIKHPLCSGDPHDFCVGAGDTLNFRLEYLDGEQNGDYGGNGFYPGYENTSVADIVISPCALKDFQIYLPVLTP